MRALLILGLGVFLLAAPGLSHGEEKIVEKAVTTVKENPGKSAGVMGCAAVLIFPPAAMLPNSGGFLGRGRWVAVKSGH